MKKIVLLKSYNFYEHTQFTSLTIITFMHRHWLIKSSYNWQPCKRNSGRLLNQNIETPVSWPKSQTKPSP